MTAFTIVLVLVLIVPGHKPVIYEDPDIGTLGACIAVAEGYLKKAIEVANPMAHYEAGCAVETPKAMDAVAPAPPD